MYPRKTYYIHHIFFKKKVNPPSLSNYINNTRIRGVCAFKSDFLLRTDSHLLATKHNKTLVSVWRNGYSTGKEDGIEVFACLFLHHILNWLLH